MDKKIAKEETDTIINGLDAITERMAQNASKGEPLVSFDDQEKLLLMQHNLVVMLDSVGDTDEQQRMAHLFSQLKEMVENLMKIYELEVGNDDAVQAS